MALIYLWQPGTDYKKILLIYSIEIVATTISVEWIYNIFEEYVYITIRTIALQTVKIMMIFVLIKQESTEIGSARAKIYAMSEMPIEGLPVKWEFCPVKGSTEDVNALKARQPDWVTSAHSLVSEDGRAYITVVEAADKTAAAVNGWAYNDGHAYLKGLYVGDYWLQKIPVKYLVPGTMLNCTGSIGGSGSSAGFFLIEYSADGQTWLRADGAKTGTFNNTEVTYHVRAYDSPLFEGENTGYFSYDFPVDVTINSGTLWVRYRVAANVRITANNTITTGGGGSTRLKGTFSVSVVDGESN